MAVKWTVVVSIHRQCCWLVVVSSFVKIQIGLTFLVPACPGCYPGKEAVKQVPVCLSVGVQGEVEQIAMMKPKAVSEHEDGMLEFLEDIIGSSRYQQPITVLSQRVEELNELRGEKVLSSSHHCCLHCGLAAAVLACRDHLWVDHSDDSLSMEMFILITADAW